MGDLGQWRFIAQRLTGDGNLGEFLDFNIPLTSPELEEVLSGHNSLSGNIDPEIARLKAHDGRPLLEEWGTAIWAEAPDGEIRGGGLLTHSGFDGPSWSIECTDLTGITIELPYTEANFWVNVDPLEIYREIWRYVQRQRGSNLGITIDGTQSPVRLGTDLVQRDPTPGEGFDLEDDPSAGLDEDPVPLPIAPPRYQNNSQWRDAAVKAMSAVGWKKDVVDDALGKWLNKDAAVENKTWKPLTDKERQIKEKSIEKVGYPPNPPVGTYKTAQVTVVDTGFAVGGTPADIADNVPGGTTEAGPVYEADEYELMWYKDHDLSQTISDLAANTPFDWHMIHRWGPDDEIQHHIRLGYPRLGRRRDELRFVVGENIKVVPSVERDGMEYANEVLVLGAGEGSSMIMGRAFRTGDKRVRKVATVSDPAIRSIEEAIKRAEVELAKRYNLEDVTDIVLSDHEHAPLGSVDLGDEILVEGETGWIDLEVWCRVVARRLSPESGETMGLTLIRSDRIA